MAISTKNFDFQDVRHLQHFHPQPTQAPWICDRDVLILHSTKMSFRWPRKGQSYGHLNENCSLQPSLNEKILFWPFWTVSFRPIFFLVSTRKFIAKVSGPNMGVILNKYYSIVCVVKCCIQEQTPNTSIFKRICPPHAHILFTILDSIVSIIQRTSTIISLMGIKNLDNK